jgi:hypothetical protein
MVKDLIKQGFTEKEVADSFGISTTDLRAYKSIAKAEVKQEQILQAEKLKAKGVSDLQAAKQMGIPTSTYKTLLLPSAKLKQDAIQVAVEVLKNQVDKVEYLDVGAGTEMYLGLSPQRLKQALTILKAEGYNIYSNIPVPQLGTSHDTKLRVLTTPDKTWTDTRLNVEKVKLLNEHLDDTGRGSLGILPPIAINPNRVAVKYGSEGGANADGVMYIRPGAKDLDLGGKTYAQVRIQVGDKHYLKGMALYKDDLPDGVDILFNTNKESTGNKLDALKKLESDPDNPFGAQIRRQITKLDPKTGKEVNASAVNIVNEEGGWSDWSRSIASQVLSKQSPSLARERLDVTYKQRKADLDEIMALTNPTVKKKLLEEFAEGTDAASIHLKAASLPKQAWHVILPVNSLSETEVYAPNYDNGQRVVLIRYPHGGTFEIPELIVNNSNREARRLLKDAKDAIAINAKVAERLSGADFDGDTVLVIPNESNKIKSSKPLQGLINFNPRETYREYPGMPVMKNTQQQMGEISNLITDMTLRQASREELERAVKHSMVVIDAEKHRLNHKQSYKDHGIKALKEKYQAKPDGTAGGASTLISRAKKKPPIPEVRLRKQSEGGPVDKKTGELVYVPTGRIDNRTGKPAKVRGFLTEMELARDASTLSSGTRMENLYADHANKLKTMANQARLESIRTPRAPYSRSAKQVYSKQVDSLERKLTEAKLNAPLERRAQILGNEILKQKKADNPALDPSSEKKLKSQALEEARNRTGAKKKKIDITPDEWAAIQAGAISDTKLKSILDNADMDKVREYATPKNKLLMSPNKVARAQALLEKYTRAEVAARLGVSLSTLDRSLGG